MTTILAAFLISLAVSLILTPLALRLGLKWGTLDLPDERKVHKQPIPRTGGLAIFISFLLSLTLVSRLPSLVSNQLSLDHSHALYLLGGMVVFGVGLFDDFRRLGPRTKFLFQLLGAALACLAGPDVMFFNCEPVLFCRILNWGATLFWFILLINAVNLIDGLDGLASGVVLFTSLMMIVLCVMGDRHVSALLFAALAGAALGFLRYNFNPASIFMGDGGSYFLGYAVAAISIMGSTKSHTGAVMLIPLLALGVPVFDTILSPVRRFVRGRKLFRPDQGHLHHKMMRMGLTTRRIVLIFYGVTLLFCVSAIVVSNLRDEKAGLFLLVVAVACFMMIRKMGYFERFAPKNLHAWWKDISDDAYFSRDRRSFLDVQIDLSRAITANEIWRHTGRALEKLSFDYAEMKVEKGLRPGGSGEGACTLKGMEESQFFWARNGFDRYDHICEACLFKMELPLLAAETGAILGTLWLVKDLKQDPIGHYTLRRVEHLRRSIVDAMMRLCARNIRVYAGSGGNPTPRKFVSDLSSRKAS